MRKFVIASAAAAALFGAPALAVAQEGTAAGVAGGAATGAVLGGPVGAVVGGVAGGVLGTAIDPPPPAVVTYVEQRPVRSVVIDGNVAVGTALPETVTLYEVPEHTQYRYAYVNDRAVIIEPRTRKVIQIVD